jgi:hypothetical protein
LQHQAKPLVLRQSTSAVPLTDAPGSRYAQGMKTVMTLLFALGLAAAVSAVPPYPIPPLVG